MKLSIVVWKREEEAWCRFVAANLLPAGGGEKGGKTHNMAGRKLSKRREASQLLSGSGRELMAVGYQPLNTREKEKTFNLLS